MNEKEPGYILSPKGFITLQIMKIFGADCTIPNIDEIEDALCHLIQSRERKAFAVAKQRCGDSSGRAMFHRFEDFEEYQQSEGYLKDE